MLTLERPGRGAPGRTRCKARFHLQGFERQHIADHFAQSSFQQSRQALPLLGRFQISPERIEVQRQRLLNQGVAHDVFIGRNLAVRWQSERLDQFGSKLFSSLRAVTVVLPFYRKKCWVQPHRLAIDSPKNIQCPAWQRLARIPLSLAVMQHAARRKMIFQAVHQLPGHFTLFVAMRQGVPFRPIHVVNRHKSRLAALGQPHILALQVGIDLLAEQVDFLPVFFFVGFGHARIFMNARDRHHMGKSNIGLVGKTGDRCRRRRHGGASQRNMAFARQHARSRVQPNPASAGHIHLGPGMQIGKVHGSSAGAVKRLLVGPQLNQIARHKSCSQAHLTHDLHQQPATVAAGTRAILQGFLWRLHAGLHAQQISNVALQPLIDRHQKIIRRHVFLEDVAPCRRYPLNQQRPRRFRLQIGAELTGQLRRIAEREKFSIFFDEKIERIDDGHVRHQVHRKFQLI